MKKVLLLIPLLTFSLLGFSQTQRLVLVEEFTQASCGPCAQQNPAFNTLLQANPTKVAILKYQTSWPGYDPMNLQNPTEVANRVSYYGVTGVPYTRLDGSLEPTGPNAYDGAPFNVTQTMINTQYAISSDFSMTASYTISSDLDSASISITISNATTGTITSGSTGSLKLRVAVVEEDMNFPSAPGTNGETEFIGVMRKMYPDAGGTTLNDSWSSSASQTFTFNVDLPDYIYDFSEVAVVAFIQDDSNKDVLQSVFSQPVALPSGAVDISHTNTTSAPSDLCATSFTPEVQITNESSTTVTSAEIELLIDGTVTATQTYTGSLATSASATVTFPAQSLTAGNTVNASFNVKSLNGGMLDYNKMNNIESGISISTVNPTAVSAPYFSQFESTNFGSLPANLIVQDATGRVYVVDQQVSTAVTWKLGAFENSDKSIRFDNYTIPAGISSSLISEKVNLSAGSNSEMGFAYAHAQYATENDALEVFVSSDCGATWTSVWQKSGSSLATHAAQTARFYPQAADWKYEKIDISSLDGESEVMVKITSTSDYGNSLYIDDIQVNKAALSLGEEAVTPDIVTFPNPATDHFTVQMAHASDFSVELLNSLGQVVRSLEYTNTQKGEVNVSDLSAGVYILNIHVNGNVSTQRITIAE